MFSILFIGLSEIGTDQKMSEKGIQNLEGKLQMGEGRKKEKVVE